MAGGVAWQIKGYSNMYRYKVIKFKLSEVTIVTPAYCVEILRQANLHNWALGYTKARGILHSLTSLISISANHGCRYFSSISMWTAWTNFW